MIVTMISIGLKRIDFSVQIEKLKDDRIIICGDLGGWTVKE